MKCKLYLIAIIGLLFLNISGLKAQTDTLKITPSHMLAARQLVSTTGMTDARFLMMRDNTIKTVSDAVPDKNRAKFVSEMIAFMNKYLPVDDFKDKFAKMYAEIFTEAELKQLIDFYNSPLGKKISSKLPELTQNAMLMDHQILVTHSGEWQAIIAESVKE
jgi:hypothetical protein